MRPEAGGPPRGEGGVGQRPGTPAGGPAEAGVRPGGRARLVHVPVTLAASRRGGTVRDIGRAGVVDEKAAAAVALHREVQELLKLERADVRAIAARCVRQRKVIVRARKSALVGGEAAEVFASVNGRTARQGSEREGRAAVVPQWAEHRVGVNLVTGRSQETAAVIYAEVVAE